MTKKLDGRAVAEAIDARIIDKMNGLHAKGIVPSIAIVRVGEKPSDIAYERGAVKKAEKLGIKPEKYICPADIEQDDLVDVIKTINNNESIHGILLLQPLPNHINANAIRNALSPEKDLDCISDDSLARLFTNDTGTFPPCTAESCMEILNHYEIPVEGKKAVIIGRSMVIGRPVSIMMMKRNATITICHTGTKPEDLKFYCRNADIIISAAGRTGMVTADMVKAGQTVIDVGINFDKSGKMTGDVCFEEVSEIVDAITPVPGGVGSVTTSLLMQHLTDAADK